MEQDLDDDEQTIIWRKEGNQKLPSREATISETLPCNSRDSWSNASASSRSLIKFE